MVLFHEIVSSKTRIRVKAPEILMNEHCILVSDVRRLERKRSGLEGDPERKKDIVDKYIDCGSQVYAPMARFGVFIDRGSEQYNIKSAYLNSYEGNILFYIIICKKLEVILISNK